MTKQIADLEANSLSLIVKDLEDLYFYLPPILVKRAVTISTLSF